MSKRVLPRPCRNCGNPLHYNCDCASWRKQGHPENKITLTGKTGEAYHKAYIAMREDDDPNYEVYYTAFHTVVDSSATPIDTDTIEISSEPPELPPVSNEESTWTNLPVNITELEELNEQLCEGIFGPSPIWEKPPGHAVQGVDAFKLCCHVNSLKEPATLVVGDSGAAPTLILKRFLDSLTASVRFALRRPYRAGAYAVYVSLLYTLLCRVPA